MDAAPTRESAKVRNRRLGLGYLLRPDCNDAGQALRTRLAAIACLAATAAAAYVSVSTQGRAFSNHGPVVDAHARFEQDCGLCHQPGQAVVPSGATVFHAKDAACQQCHFAPAHFDHQRFDALEPSCFSCHHDHQGRSADLKRQPDAACSACHADAAGLAKAASRSPPPGMAAAFAAGQHPEFPLAVAKSQHLKFNHAKHLAAGLGTGMTVGKLRADVKNPPDRSAVLLQLDCSACHERAGGAREEFAPVKYERHCAACHPLSAPGYAGEQVSAAVVPNIAIPHGINGKSLRDFLAGAYAVNAGWKVQRAAVG